MKKRAALLLPLFLISLSACDSNNKKTSPYVEPAKDINTMADFEQMVEENPIKNESTKTPVRYSLNVNLDFKNSGKQYKMKDVELIGNGHELKNIQIIESNNCGLFSTVKNCIFSNLVIEDSEIRGDVAGALVGYADIGIFKNIKITETVRVGDGSTSQIGGIVGKADNASFDGCENNAEVWGMESVGGIVGYSYNSDITHCKNLATIKDSTVGNDVGGIAGTYKNSWQYDARQDLFDSNENSGDILAPQCENVGGLIGKHDPEMIMQGSQLPTVNFSNCLNSGVVKGKDRVGGISGNAYSDLCNVTVTKCTNSGTVMGQNYVGGIVGETKDFRVSVEYKEGDKLTFVKFNGCETELNEDGDNYVSGVKYVGGIAGNGSSFNDCDNNIEVRTEKSNEYLAGASYYEEYQCFIGGIVGYGFGNCNEVLSKIVSCTNNGKVSGVVTAGKPYTLASAVGGICGFSFGGTFFSCTNNAEIYATQCVGGILGALETKNTDKNTSFSDCESNGNLVFLKSGGGIVGDIEVIPQFSMRITIVGCTVDIEEAKIYGSTDAMDNKFVAGGFIGRAVTTSIESSDYKKVTLMSSEATLKYRTLEGATNMVVDAYVGYNQKCNDLDAYPMVFINSDPETGPAVGETTWLGYIE